MRGAIADQPGAEQRRHLRIAGLACHRETKSLIGERVLLVAAIDVVTGEACRRAQVLAPRSAEPTLAAGPAEPGHAHAIAFAEPLDVQSGGGDTPDDLVPRNDGQVRLRQLPVHDVQIGAAYAASPDPHQDLARSGLRHGALAFRERGARHFQNHCPHAAMLLPFQDPNLAG